VSEPLDIEATAPLGGCAVTAMELISKLPLSVVMSGTKFFVMVPPMLVPSGSAFMVTVPPEVVTVKSLVLVIVTQFSVTEIFPEVAPVGTVVVMLVAVLAVTTASSPLKSIKLLAGVVLKFVPVIITVVLGNPLAGEKEVMVGAGPQSTIKSVALETPSHAT
jgi:hypothetical protein